MGHRASKAAIPGTLLLTVLACLASSGCHPVPIQIGRTSQIDFYTQYYDFSGVDQPDSVLVELVGQQNFNILLRKYKRNETLKTYLRDSIEVRGALNFSIYPMPTARKDSFFVDGIGRYALVYKRTNNIMLSGDFYIKNNRFSIQDLEKNVLRIHVEQSLIRYSHPDSVSYFESDSVFFNIRMKTISSKKGIYRIDYAARHNLIYGNRIIGYLEYDKLPANKYKLIDVRGRSFVKNDYMKHLQTSERDSSAQYSAK
ncbi:MAG: hypothetical protein ACE5IY_15630 [bacterium]